MISWTGDGSFVPEPQVGSQQPNASMHDINVTLFCSSAKVAGLALTHLGHPESDVLSYVLLKTDKFDFA